MRIVSVITFIDLRTVFHERYTVVCMICPAAEFYVYAN
jgi:hypothetical protein